MRFRTISGLLLAGVLALAGCGSATTEAAALAFASQTLDGAEFDGSQLAGKPAVLWFWAPWCPTCRAQAPTVTHLVERYDGEVSVVGVGDIRD